MTDTSKSGHNDIPDRYRQHDHSWMLVAWVLPVTIAAVLTVVSGGFLAITLPVALAIGVVATLTHSRS
ncbi:MAG TPA: hypothetical protein VJX66_14085 [Amycolatopsis sp.]|nr:hypothetical protein [Amycolatopsis sp.]